MTDENTTQVTDEDVNVAILEVKVEELEKKLEESKGLTETTQWLLQESQKELRTARRGYVSKDVVRRAADYGIRKFGFCEQIEKTLTKFNLVGPDQIKLKVDLGQFGSTTLSVSAEEFENQQNDDARKTYLSEKITLKVEVGNGVTLEGGGVHPPVISYEEVPEEVYSAVDLMGELPDGYAWKYTSNEGRVQHLIDNSVGDERHRRSVCGAESTSFYNAYWREHSSRAETDAQGNPRRCSSCTTWLARNGTRNA